MDIKQLRAFLTVAETGNVTRAAELLNIVQPAVSRQLRLLEEDIGAELFERGRHGMVLTEAGRSLVGHARNVMLELERARAEIIGSASGVTGHVKLGLLPSTCDLLASRLVGAMAENYSGIRLTIAMAYSLTLQTWLEAGEIDAALLYDPKQSPAVQTEPVVEETLWVIGLPSAKLKRNRPVPLASLAGTPLILPSPQHGLRMLVDHACALAGVALNIVAETNAMSIQKSLVLGGHGMTILPAIAVADEITHRQVSAAPLSNPTLTRTIVLGLPTTRAITQPVRCAVSVLLKCIKEAQEKGDWAEARWLAA